MSQAWLFQKADDVRELGEDAAPWLVGWQEPDGRRRSKTCGAGKQGKKTAERLRNKLTAELMTGTYQQKTTVLWDDFVGEYDRRTLAGLAPRTREEALVSLAHFKRLVKPVRVFGLCTSHVDDFIAARRKEPGLRPGTLLSPATINKDMRHIKAALHLAEEWGYLPKVPRFRMEKVGKKLPTYITPEHFAAVYAACDCAVRPKGLPYPAGQWWRSLLMTGFMTGWRIGSLLALRRDDVDLEAGTARSRFEDNKGRRDQLIALHPAVIDHLRLVPSFSPVFFPWDHGHRQLFEGLHAIQEAAGVKPSHDKPFYGFHDLRRAFATLNADRLTPDALQALMQHKDYQTTQRYISLARQLRPAVDNLYVPPLPPRKADGG